MVALLLAGCAHPPEISTSPVSTPAPPVAAQTPGLVKAPLKLPDPPPPPRKLGQVDLSKLDADQLSGAMQELYHRADYPAAATAGQWAIQKGGDGRYDLACCLALSGRAEEAFYFLQEAARLEGVDPVHAGRDPDLDVLRTDSRWKVVAAYLEDMGRHWAEKELIQTTLVLPHDYKREQPIAVVVGLHGLGGNERFVDQQYQALANQLGVAFVGLNGTVTLGPKAFRWSEDLARDQTHLQKALDSLKTRFTPAPGQMLLFGFSQGAEIAWELAAAHPESYRGALAFSAGLQVDHPLPQAVAANAVQHFVFTAGAGENPETLRHTRQGAEWCEKARARVKLKIYPGMHTHSFPPDFATQFGPWLQWGLQSSPSSSTSKIKVALGGMTPPAPPAP